MSTSYYGALEHPEPAANQKHVNNRRRALLLGVALLAVTVCALFVSLASVGPQTTRFTFNLENEQFREIVGSSALDEAEKHYCVPWPTFCTTFDECLDKYYHGDPQNKIPKELGDDFFNDCQNYCTQCRCPKKYCEVVRKQADEDAVLTSGSPEKEGTWGAPAFAPSAKEAGVCDWDQSSASTFEQTNTHYPACPAGMGLYVNGMNRDWSGHSCMSEKRVFLYPDKDLTECQFACVDLAECASIKWSENGCSGYALDEEHHSRRRLHETHGHGGLSMDEQCYEKDTNIEGGPFCCMMPGSSPMEPMYCPSGMENNAGFIRCALDTVQNTMGEVHCSELRHGGKRASYNTKAMCARFVEGVDVMNSETDMDVMFKGEAGALVIRSGEDNGLNNFPRVLVAFSKEGLSFWQDLGDERGLNKISPQLPGEPIATFRMTEGLNNDFAQPVRTVDFLEWCPIEVEHTAPVTPWCTAEDAISTGGYYYDRNGAELANGRVIEGFKLIAQDVGCAISFEDVPEVSLRECFKACRGKAGCGFVSYNPGKTAAESASMECSLGFVGRCQAGPSAGKDLWQMINSDVAYGYGVAQIPVEDGVETSGAVNFPGTVSGDASKAKQSFIYLPNNEDGYLALDRTSPTLEVDDDAIVGKSFTIYGEIYPQGTGGPLFQYSAQDLWEAAGTPEDDNTEDFDITYGGNTYTVSCSKWDAEEEESTISWHCKKTDITFADECPTLCAGYFPVVNKYGCEGTACNGVGLVQSSASEVSATAAYMGSEGGIAANSVSAKGEITQNKWNEVAATYDFFSGDLKMWIDGFEVDSVDAGSELDLAVNFPVYMGAVPQGNGDAVASYAGYMRCFAIYQEALLAEDIMQLTKACPGTGALNEGQLYNVKVKAQGEVLTAYLDGREVLSAFDRNPRNGGFGFATYKARMQAMNLKVIDPDTGRTLIGDLKGYVAGTGGFQLFVDGGLLYHSADSKPVEVTIPLEFESMAIKYGKDMADMGNWNPNKGSWTIDQTTIENTKMGEFSTMATGELGYSDLTIEAKVRGSARAPMAPGNCKPYLVSGKVGMVGTNTCENSAPRPTLVFDGKSYKSEGANTINPTKDTSFCINTQESVVNLKSCAQGADEQELSLQADGQIQLTNDDTQCLAVDNDRVGTWYSCRDGGRFALPCYDFQQGSGTNYDSDTYDPWDATTASAYCMSWANNADQDSADVFSELPCLLNNRLTVTDCDGGDAQLWTVEDGKIKLTADSSMVIGVQKFEENSALTLQADLNLDKQLFTVGAGAGKGWCTLATTGTDLATTPIGWYYTQKSDPALPVASYAISISTATGDASNDEGPQDWTFEGTTADQPSDSDWTVLDTVTGNVAGGVIRRDIAYDDDDNVPAYKSFRLQVTKTIDDTATQATIYELQIFKYNAFDDCSTTGAYGPGQMSGYKYVGCFDHKDQNFGEWEKTSSGGIDRSLTWSQCRDRAMEKGSKWFMQEYPQGNGDRNSASCGMRKKSDMQNKMQRIEDSRCAKYDGDEAGHLMGDASTFALYKLMRVEDEFTNEIGKYCSKNYENAFAVYTSVDNTDAELQIARDECVAFCRDAANCWGCSVRACSDDGCSWAAIPDCGSETAFSGRIEGDLSVAPRPPVAAPAQKATKILDGKCCEANGMWRASECDGDIECCHDHHLAEADGGPAYTVWWRGMCYGSDKCSNPYNLAGCESFTLAEVGPPPRSAGPYEKKPESLVGLAGIMFRSPEDDSFGFAAIDFEQNRIVAGQSKDGEVKLTGRAMATTQRDTDWKYLEQYERPDTANNYWYTCTTGGSYATYNANTLTSTQRAKASESWPGQSPPYYACVQGCAGGCTRQGSGTMDSVAKAPDGIPIRCDEEAGYLECASNNNRDCFWGQYTGEAYQSMADQGITASSPLRTACPGWATADGSDACEVLGCYGSHLTEFEGDFDLDQWYAVKAAVKGEEVSFSVDWSGTGKHYRQVMTAQIPGMSGNGMVGLMSNDLMARFKNFNMGFESPNEWRCMKWKKKKYGAMRRTKDGHIECMSKDGKNCIWKNRKKKCKKLLKTPPATIKPYQCSDKDYKKRWCKKALLRVPGTVKGANDNEELAYLGCYVDGGNRDLPNRMSNSNSNGPQYCAAECRKKSSSYKYFGLQWTHECFCDSQPPGSYGGPQKDKECNKVCPGDSRFRCGGGWRNSVYSLSVAAASKVEAEMPEAISGFAASFGSQSSAPGASSDEKVPDSKTRNGWMCSSFPVSETVDDETDTAEPEGSGGVAMSWNSEGFQAESSYDPSSAGCQGCPPMSVGYEWASPEDAEETQTTLTGIASAESCRMRCTLYDGCKYFVYASSSSECYLRYHLTRKVENADTTSGHPCARGETILTMTDPNSDYDGTTNPFQTDLNADEPSTTTAYSVNLVGQIEPKEGDIITMERSSDNAFVSFEVSTWCGWERDDPYSVEESIAGIQALLSFDDGVDGVYSTYDSVGDYDWSTSGSPTFGEGKFGQAMVFDGSYRVGYNLNGALSEDNFGVALWFKGTGSGGLFNADTAGHDRHLYILSDTSMGIRTWPHGRQDFTTPSVQDDKWHFVAYSVGPSGEFVWLDGAQVHSRTSVTYSNFNWETNVFFGHCVDKGFYTSGSIDEAMLFTNELSFAEVTELYNAGTGYSGDGTTSCSGPCGVDGADECEMDANRGYALGQLYDSNGAAITGYTYFGGCVTGCGEGDGVAFSKDTETTNDVAGGVYGGGTKSSTGAFVWGTEDAIDDTLTLRLIAGEFSGIGTGSCTDGDGNYPNSYTGTAADNAACRAMCSQYMTCFAYQFDTEGTSCMLFVPGDVENPPTDYEYATGTADSCPSVLGTLDTAVVYEKRNSDGSAWSSFSDIGYTCTADEYYGSLGTFDTARDCLSAAKFNININYVIWRGDYDNQCHGCMVSDAALEEELEGAVSFRMNLNGCGLSSQEAIEWKQPSVLSDNVGSEISNLDPDVAFLTVGPEADVEGYCVFDNTATCDDNFHNGDEEGIDCGGSCDCACSGGVCSS